MTENKQDKSFLDSYDGDVYLYYGDIDRSGYHKISDALEGQESPKSKSCLILITHGGDPDAAYRTARAFSHYYKGSLEILVPDTCKSAGTLLCIGANKLIFGDRGELGPLDIQLSKPDEMQESMSGLDIIQAVNNLDSQVLESFRNYLVDIRYGSRLRTKLAADIATKLVNAFISPIAAKIDPVMLGEHQRAMQIAYDYGTRLNQMSNCLKDDSALVNLISSYPTHGFVIDRKEAATLFKTVSAPDNETMGLYLWARDMVKRIPYPQGKPLVVDLVKEMQDPSKKEEEQRKHDEETKADNDNRDDDAEVKNNNKGPKRKPKTPVEENGQTSENPKE